MPFRFSFRLPAMSLRRHLLALVLHAPAHAGPRRDVGRVARGSGATAWSRASARPPRRSPWRLTASGGEPRALDGLAASEALAADDLPAFHDRAVLARHQHPNWHS